ncbi:MAG: RNA polymerase sigma factor [Candidatus Latescibacteria bacterium]|nr:RNA polymerase sigma factor [Candidatus Latescibacterota bacterium]
MPVAEQERAQNFVSTVVDDVSLVSRFKSGDEKAFAEIVKFHQPRLLQVATVLLQNEQDAMDTVQDVFVKAYFKLGSFREDSSLYTWLYRILYNRCISFLRRKKIVKFLSFSTEEEESIDFPSNDPAPDKVYERSEILLSITEALGKLPLRQRTVFTMKQMDDLKFSEISEITGITEGAAKASYFHAVKKLQTLLRHFGDVLHE